MFKNVMLSLFVSSFLIGTSSFAEETKSNIKQVASKKVENKQKEVVVDTSKEEIASLKKEIASLNEKLTQTQSENKSSVNLNDEVLVYLITSLSEIKQKISSIENNVIEYKFEGNFDPSVYSKYKVTSNILVETNENNKVVNVYTLGNELIGKKDGNLLITSTGKVDLSKVVEIK